MDGIEIKGINNWFEGIPLKPLIISGPCSAETEEQLLLTAKAVAKIDKVKVLRAGIWKPRTRPGSFEGVGTIGLQWMKIARKESGLLTTVEVTTPEDIEECLKAEIDILWIGARSSSNPVYIRKLAEALKGVDIPLLIKNPIHPDIDLWMGTIERFYDAGIRRMAAVHRGFSPFEKTSLRNIPKWEIPIELKRRIPALSIICDPSHIAGNTEYIFEISQKALYLGMEGLMIESHINPGMALSDAKQQLTPAELALLLDKLVFTCCQDEFEKAGMEQFRSELEMLREQLNSIDQQMVELLAQRMDVVKGIAEYKMKHNMSIFQLRRWRQTLELNTGLGKKMGLSEDFLVKLISLIHMESIQKQDEIIREIHERNERESDE